MPGLTVPAVLQKEPGAAVAASATQVGADAVATVLNLNRTLDELQQGAHSQATAGQIAAALAAAVDALRREGIGGVSVIGDGAAARLALDREALAASLNRSDGTTAGISGVPEPTAAQSIASGQPGGPAIMHSGYEIATRLRAQMTELLNGAGARTKPDEPAAAMAATTPIGPPSNTRPPADGRPRRVLEGLTSATRVLDSGGPLHRALLPLGDDEDDELSTF
jgi:hypothetical protein